MTSPVFKSINEGIDAGTELALKGMDIALAKKKLDAETSRADAILNMAKEDHKQKIIDTERKIVSEQLSESLKAFREEASETGNQERLQSIYNVAKSAATKLGFPLGISYTEHGGFITNTRPERQAIAEKELRDKLAITEKPVTVSPGEKLMKPGTGEVIGEGGPKVVDIKSVDFGNRVGIYKDGVFDHYESKGVNPTAATAPPTDPNDFRNWTTDEKDSAAVERIITGKDVLTGRMGNAISRLAFDHHVRQYMVNNRISPQMKEAARADMAANDSSLKKQRFIYAAMEGYVNNLKAQIDIAKDAYAKLPRSSIKLLNMPMAALNKYVGSSGDEAMARMVIMDISREITKLAGGATASIAAPSVEEIKNWDKVHDYTLSPNDIIKVLDTSLELGIMRLSTAGKVMDATLKAIENAPTPGGFPVGSPMPQPTGATSAVDQLKEKAKSGDQKAADYLKKKGIAY